MHPSGRLFSAHFLAEGIKTIGAYQALAGDPARITSIRRRLEPVFSAFPIHEADPGRDPVQRPPQGHLRELKDSALTLLYRLLFVLYAEDRELLPVRDARYDDYALRNIRKGVAAQVDDGDVFAKTIGNYYGRARGLFRAIDKGEPSLGLPPYNGGLIDPRRAPLLERIELPDAVFAPVLDRLSRIHDGEQRRWINYRDLSVQQLGSIYERLLEHQVIAPDGQIQVKPDETARKGSGSFYTPEVWFNSFSNEPLARSSTSGWSASGNVPKN